MDVTPAGGLLERGRELEGLRRAMDQCRQGRGLPVIVEGPPGIGKTSLLVEARRLADAEGMRVVSARGAELERGFPFGVVRQFFESFLFSVAASEREQWIGRTQALDEQMHADAPSGDADQFALLHSLYWMCVTIADERPVVMVLDDAQWSDAPSLRFVEFACRRVEQVALMFVIATRPLTEDAPGPLLAVTAEPAAELLHPGRLSLDAVAQLVAEQIDQEASREFIAACHEVTGGNPFFVQEVLRELRAEGLPASSLAAERVRQIGPRSIARMVLLRLRRLPASAHRMAIALSVAADSLTVPDLARLAGLSDAEDTHPVLASLEQADIVHLRGGRLQFTHPVLRAAVYEDLAAVERAELHLRAAEILRERGRRSVEIAAQLMHAPADRVGWAASILRDAAHESESAGDFRTALALLGRVLQEPDEGGERCVLLAQLGRVEARTGAAAGEQHLREALAVAEAPATQVEVAVELSNVLRLSQRPAEAADVLIETLERLGSVPEELRRRLLAGLLGTRLSTDLDARIRPAREHLTAPSGTPRDRLDAYLLAEASWDLLSTLGPRADVVELGRRALELPIPGDDAGIGAQTLVVAGATLTWAEDFEFAYARLSQALEQARRAGSRVAVGNTSTDRAECGYRMGRLLEAEADAAAVAELAVDVAGLQSLRTVSTSNTVLIGIERGIDLGTLHAIAFDPSLNALNEFFTFPQLQWARGELLLLEGEYEQALEHLRDCQRPDPTYGGENPAMVPWREAAAQALVQLGDDLSARALADEAVARAHEFGAPRALGVALRAAALVQTGSARVDGLREAVRTLERANAALELARARCDLGAALRAAGKRTEAQEALGPAHELARALGASRLAERAAAELTAAGVRPRRELLGGVAALTPSERRVAQLAAGGQTNREIAQALFVTEKTVETHLGHVYDKLGVRSRRKLPGALATPLTA